MNIPPLSNFEQKQIVEGLLHHPNEKALNLDEAQAFATNKAIEIGKYSSCDHVSTNNSSSSVR